MRLGEAQNRGPATHDRDLTAQQQNKATPASDVSTKQETQCRGSQDSITRRVQNLQISDTRATQTAPPAPAPAPMTNFRRPPQARPKQQPREYLRCAQCGPDPAAFKAVSDHGLVCTWFRSTGDNGCFQNALRSSAISIVQPEKIVTPSGRGDVVDAPSAEVILRSETFLLAIPFRTVANPDTRMQRPAARPPVQQPPQSSQPVPPGDSLNDSPLPNWLPSATSFSRSETSSYSPNFAGPFCDGSPALEALSLVSRLHGQRGPQRH